MSAVRDGRCVNGSVSQSNTARRCCSRATGEGLLARLRLGGCCPHLAASANHHRDEDVSTQMTGWVPRWTACRARRASTMAPFCGCALCRQGQIRVESILRSQSPSTNLNGLARHGRRLLSVFAAGHLLTSEKLPARCQPQSRTDIASNVPYHFDYQFLNILIALRALNRSSAPHEAQNGQQRPAASLQHHLHTVCKYSIDKRPLDRGGG